MHKIFFSYRIHLISALLGKGGGGGEFKVVSYIFFRKKSYCGKNRLEFLLSVIKKILSQSRFTYFKLNYGDISTT